MKKKLICLVLILIPMVLLSACACEHEWMNATCETPVTCSKCGETAGDPIMHVWAEATCTSPKTCFVCNQTEGDLAGHSWRVATCTSPKTCSLCSTTEGNPAGHNWRNATCTAPKTCSVCKSIEGSALGHTWLSATCTAPKKCSSCGLTEGIAKEHSYENGECETCGKTDPVYDTVAKFNSRIKIYGTSIYVDSAGGVSVYLTWENKSEKEIKYMYFRVELYNRVNDLLDCDISGKTSMVVRQTGPIPYGKGSYSGKFVYTRTAQKHFIPGTISRDEYDSDKDNGWAEQYWDNVWYNSTAHYIKITGIQIEYMDGTIYKMLDENFFDNLGIINVTKSDSLYDY